MLRRTRGRHRKGTAGLVWCRSHAVVDAALTRPEVARRGLFERLLTPSRHLLPRDGRPALAAA